MPKERSFAVALVAFNLLAIGPAFAASFADGTTVAHNTPKFVSTSRNLGRVDPSTVMDVSVWLKPHDKAGMDALAKELYDPASAKYQHWLTKAEFTAKYAPTAEEANTVARFLTSNHLKIAKMGPDNFYVRATGTAGAISAAFRVTLNNYEVNGKTERGNTEDPYIAGEAGNLVGAVSGLDTLGYTHPLAQRMMTKKTPVGGGGVASGGVTAEAAKPLATGVLPASAFSSQCFPRQTKETFTSSGSLPEATYKGNEYTTNVSGCGYTPANIQAAYNLNPLYAEKYDGKGQTIVILDWCGSPTITADANAFSKQFGLPPLTSKNFQIIYTPTPSYCAAPDVEINIDVEWAHAIAPGAAITLVVPPSNSFQDIDEGLFYAVDYQLGNSISNSYGSEELYTPETVLKTEDLICETGAILGISVNFSSGDDGDYTFDDPKDYAPSVSAPADSPYATAVGGVSLALNRDNTIAWQTGWGTNLNLVAAGGYVEDPPSGPDAGFFNFGAGGGESAFYYQPYYQTGIGGIGRQLPDIAWLADPYTGAYISISVPGVIPELQYEVYGGTSLACPMFSALWAIANQEAGKPLGQAAPYLYKMPKSTITDIVPYASGHNIQGVVTNSSGTKEYKPAELAAPLEGTTQYVSVLWNYPLYEDTAYILTFGTDSGLATTVGWDNVTGVGVPNGKAFADYFKP